MVTQQFHGKPAPTLGNSFGEEIFPNIQSKSPLVQLEVISSHAKGTVMPLLAFSISKSNNF